MMKFTRSLNAGARRDYFLPERKSDGDNENNQKAAAMASRKIGHLVQEKDGQSCPYCYKGKSRCDSYAAGLESNQSRFRAEEEKNQKGAYKKKREGEKGTCL